MARAAPLRPVQRRPTDRNHRTYFRARAVFLEELMKGWSVTWAARIAGLPRTQFYHWRDGGPTGAATIEGFKEAWAEAVEAGTDKLEDEAYRRAHDGIPKPIFHQGEQIATVQEYSDNLMKFLLEGRRSDKFRQKVTVDGSQEIKVTITGGLPPRPIESKE